MNKNFYEVSELNNIYMVRLNEIDGLSFVQPRGSYNILKARLFDISYPNFLRMAKANYGAQLKGRKGIIIEFFTDKAQADKLCKALNTRLNQVLVIRDKQTTEFLNHVKQSLIFTEKDEYDEQS